MKLFFTARDWYTMKPSTIRIVILFLVLIFSLWIRTYNLALTPPVLLEKEERVGLIAYSLLRSDFISYQNLFSQNISSIDNSFLGPLTILTTIPFIKTFGLSTWSVRFPSALAGFLTIIMFLFFAKTVTEKIQKTQSDKQSLQKTVMFSLTSLSLIFFALSPWHIQISRIDTGINLGLFFLLLGASLALKAVNNPKLLFFWTIPFVLSVYSDFIFFLPSIAVILIALIFYHKAFSLRFPKTVISLLIFLLLVLPILQRGITYSTKIDDGVTALLIRNENQAASRIAYSNNTPISKLLHSNQIENLKLHIKQFTSYIEPQQLFVHFTGDKDIISPYSGLFFPLDLIFLVAGLYFLLIQNNKKSLVFFLSWVIIILLPPSFMSSKTNALRSVLILPPIIALLAFGCIELFHNLKTQKRYIVFVGISLFFSYFFLRFLFFYFSSYSSTPRDYHKEYLQAFSYTAKHISKTKRIIVTDISFGKDLYLKWLFTFPPSKSDFGYIKKPSDPTIISQYNNYSFISKPPSHYYREVVYIQPSQTIPKKAKILFYSSSAQKEDQIAVFIVRK